MRDDKLWNAFSLYIRYRDVDETGYGKCIVTGKVIHWSEGDAGHFISRRHLATKYHEQNVHLQSRQSNRFHGGDQYAYGRAIDLKYGPGTADKLLVLSRQVCKRGKFEIDVMTDYYRKLAKELKEKKGL